MQILPPKATKYLFFLQDPNIGDFHPKKELIGGIASSGASFRWSISNM
jgi:hypothetical protein